MRHYIFSGSLDTSSSDPSIPRIRNALRNNWLVMMPYDQAVNLVLGQHAQSAPYLSATDAQYTESGVCLALTLFFLRACFEHQEWSVFKAELSNPALITRMATWMKKQEFMLNYGKGLPFDIPQAAQYEISTKKTMLAQQWVTQHAATPMPPFDETALYINASYVLGGLGGTDLPKPGYDPKYGTLPEQPLATAHSPYRVRYTYGRVTPLAVNEQIDENLSLPLTPSFRESNGPTQAAYHQLQFMQYKISKRATAVNHLDLNKSALFCFRGKFGIISPKSSGLLKDMSPEIYTLLLTRLQAAQTYIGNCDLLITLTFTALESDGKPMGRHIIGAYFPRNDGSPEPTVVFDANYGFFGLHPCANFDICLQHLADFLSELLACYSPLSAFQLCIMPRAT
ncbi:MAG: hypothetical protein A3J38_02825 [Gammaproteobacteria bacterium RIFCSPHIGHO2_12_FULL_45_9]|nr:MAG: hypothetical protein A3J38_02825 [Gammaproteobacteria bacterium RIFCSPHIGHO2_12_FULL_45_9]